MSVSAIAINEFAASWAPLLWKASWQGGLALLFVLILFRFCGEIPGRVQCWLWRLAYIKLLTTGLWIAPLELPWLPAERPVSSSGMSNLKAELPALLNTPGEIEIHFLSPDETDGHRNAAEQPGLSVWSLLLILWIFAMSVMLANLAKQWLLVRRMVASLSLVADPHLLDRLHNHCRRMNVRRVPKLGLCPRSTTPFLVRLVRPMIVIPVVLLESCSDEELDAVLMHELGHVNRNDLWWNWLPTLAEVTFCFHPLVWMAKLRRGRVPSPPFPRPSHSPTHNRNPDRTNCQFEGLLFAW